MTLKVSAARPVAARSIASPRPNHDVGALDGCCEYCGRWFEDRRAYRVHWQRKHNPDYRHADTWMTPARFWAKVDRGDDCWEWTGIKDPNGYGRCGMFGETLAHRVAWKLTREAIPGGLFVLHRCDNPPCCNPDHLFLGTQADNIADMDHKGRRRNWDPGQFCKRGHPRIPENIYPWGGKRYCRVCRLERSRTS